MTRTASPPVPCPTPLPLAELRQLNVRRVLFVGPSVAMAVILVGAAVGVLVSIPHGWLDWMLLVPFALAMCWECLVVWQLVLGFAQWLRGRDACSPIERLADTIEPRASGASRTALLVPIFEEDVAAVFRRVDVMLRSLARLGSCGDVELHVLSDTRVAATSAAEEEEARVVAGRHPACVLRYRRRADNAGRKAGNIAEFLDGEGHRFDFAIVLDADSLLTGEAVRRLIRVMEASPRVGLLQTVSYAAGRDTLFARIQQFAIRVYAPLALRGLHFWQGSEGSYWGHNAIFRVAPFRQHCRLPVLSGRPPLGGEILCHDVVEGALLARAGWEVHLLPEFAGTWEEMPTNTVDLLARERRWCQGNLQHMRLLAWPGLRAASRAHLAFGIVGYLVVPAWWCFVLGGASRIIVEPDGACGLLAYGLCERGPAAILLATLSLILIATPRLLSLIRAGWPRSARRDFGGGRRLVASALLEQGAALLLGPVLSLACAGFVIGTLAGINIGWRPQARGERRIGLREAFRQHGVGMLLGVVLLAAASRAGGFYAGWILPTAIGLVIGPWIAILGSRADLGHWTRRLGLFMTQDDLSAPVELQDLAGTDTAVASLGLAN